MRILACVSLTAGILMTISCIPHAALGWGEQSRQLQALEAPPDLVTSLGIGWIFGSFAMAAMGLVVTLTAWRFLRQGVAWTLPAVVIAFAYIIFGGYGFYVAEGNSHMAAFSALGLLAGCIGFCRTKPRESVASQ